MSKFGFINSVYSVWMKCTFHSGKETKIFFQGWFYKLFPQQFGTGVVRKKNIAGNNSLLKRDCITGLLVKYMALIQSQEGTYESSEPQGRKLDFSH